jgi:hypothetical protein
MESEKGFAEIFLTSDQTLLLKQIAVPMKSSLRRSKMPMPSVGMGKKSGRQRLSSLNRKRKAAGDTRKLKPKLETAELWRTYRAIANVSRQGTQLKAGKEGKNL